MQDGLDDDDDDDGHCLVLAIKYSPLPPSFPPSLPPSLLPSYPPSLVPTHLDLTIHHTFLCAILVAGQFAEH
jgi:hypothetical protein